MAAPTLREPPAEPPGFAVTFKDFMMRYACLTAFALVFGATAALAQGGSPYNSSGSQAGGPLGGQERAAGARGGAPSSDAMPMKKKKMKSHRRHRM